LIFDRIAGPPAKMAVSGDFYSFGHFKGWTGRTYKKGWTFEMFRRCRSRWLAGI